MEKNVCQTQRSTQRELWSQDGRHDRQANGDSHPKHGDSDLAGPQCNPSQPVSPVESWQNVPEEYKKSLYTTLFQYFDLNSLKETIKWEETKLGIYAECQSSYRKRKGVLMKHFEDSGGWDDVEGAKACPPKGWKDEKWADQIDRLYMNPQYKHRCEQNKANRAKHRYPSFHGTRSYAQQRYIDREKTGSSSYVESFKKNHHKDGTGWVNANAEEDWKKIQEELDKEPSEDAETHVNELEVMERALGSRCGHIKGAGRTVRRIIPDISSSYPVPQQHEWQQMNDELKELKEQQQQSLQREQQYQQQLQQTQQTQELLQKTLEEILRRQRGDD